MFDNASNNTNSILLLILLVYVSKIITSNMTALGDLEKSKEHLSDAKGRFQKRVFHGEYVLYFRSMPFANERLPKELQ